MLADTGNHGKASRSCVSSALNFSLLLSWVEPNGSRPHPTPSSSIPFLSFRLAARPIRFSLKLSFEMISYKQLVLCYMTIPQVVSLSLWYGID